MEGMLLTFLVIHRDWFVGKPTYLLVKRYQVKWNLFMLLAVFYVDFGWQKASFASGPDKWPGPDIQLIL